MSKICPKCGNTTFYASAHIVQDWKVDGSGNFIKVAEDCVETTHRPDDDDLWTCARCGYENAGKEFNSSDTESEDALRAHEAYKLEWMLAHGYTLSDLVSAMQSQLDDNDGKPVDLQELFTEWEEDAGFDGTLWPCFGEFYTTEYQMEKAEESGLSQRAKDIIFQLLELIRAELQSNGPEKEFDDWKDADDWLFASLDLTKRELEEIYKGKPVLVCYDTAAEEKDEAEE